MEQIKQLEKQILELQLKVKKQDSIISKAFGFTSLLNNLLIVILVSATTYLALLINPALIALFNVFGFIGAQLIIYIRNRFTK